MIQHTSYNHSRVMDTVAAVTFGRYKIHEGRLVAQSPVYESMYKCLWLGGKQRLEANLRQFGLGILRLRIESRSLPLLIPSEFLPRIMVSGPLQLSVPVRSVIDSVHGIRAEGLWNSNYTTSPSPSRPHPRRIISASNPVTDSAHHSFPRLLNTI